ncbi:siderophore-interacting protein [Amnibacterium flavum]|uniref:NADPH-dependent ferric siderophore reductase n=1 Tax=Amnibacterium flavum TaxID=2173173 RepID=A0A2V1HSG6_9MICO|nr:siderophore-interacting protein [Amnibacterium flavum]PVZ95281.1 NADPH-dependent ferric siderophore reductase [Amnibacterium flavum]
MARGLPRRVEPDEKVILHAHVLRTERVSPSFQRVTITGEALRRYAPLGYDQWFRLFLPAPGHNDMKLPKNPGGLLGYARFLAIPKASRPALRNYTTRAYRHGVEGGALPELDIDFVLHGDEGFASGWAARAQPGDEVALLDEGILYVPHETTRRHLIITDETGLPALAAIGESLPRDAVGDAVLEVADRADAELMTLPAGMTLHVLERAEGLHPGSAALARVEELALDVDGLYPFAVGESSLATGARRHFVSERGLPKEQMTFCGYWKAGH